MGGTPDLRIITTRLPGGGDLVRDYLAGRNLQRFYAGQPSDPAAYRRKAEEVDRRLDAAARQRVAPAIHALGDAADRLERILGGDGFFVTTGQQPALFGGPLYTVYKILAAVRLAADLEQVVERPVLALFWVGSDDHDWDEANHATVLDRADYPRRIAVSAPPGSAPVPLAEREWGKGIEAAVDELTTLLPRTAFGERLTDHVRSVYTPSATVAASSTATLRLLLADRRLALVDSAHPAVRRAAAPVLRHEAEHALDHVRRTAAQTQRLVEAGYSAQVAVPPDASNLMLIDAQGRDRLLRTRGGWVSRREHSVMSDAELLHRIDATPESFSPNVLLRPVVESALFPTVAYVAGPGEISYFAQIGCLFDAHGILPPVVVPRPGVTLVTPAISRVLDRLGMEPEEVRGSFDALASAVVRRSLPASVRTALDELERELYERYAGLSAAAVEVDPTLAGPLMAARNASLVRLREAEKRLVTQLKRRNAVLVEQVRRAAAHLQPNGAPQERVLNILTFAAEYGPRLIDEIEGALDTGPAHLAGLERAPVP